MRITNVQTFHEDGYFEEKEIFIRDGRFAACPQAGEEIVDGEGCYAIPGLTDIHFHGCVGVDFCDGTQQAIEKIARYEAMNGVTSICPATMTLDEESLLHICRTGAAYRPIKGADLVGIHLEGPFLSYEKRGAQNPAFLQKPDPAFFYRLQEAAGGLVRLMAIAPELENALELIQELEKEITLSVAHTTADYETAREAFFRGAKQATHLYNAMPAFSHRAPGVVGAVFDSPGCRAELICDGIHIHPSVVRATLKMFGDERIIFISDSTMATGMPDGEYQLGKQAVQVKGKRCTLADGTLAGSSTNLLDCVRTAVKEIGISLASAVKCAAVNPAKAIGIFDSYGSICPGKYANLLLMDKQLNLKQVLLHGQKLT